MYCKQSTWVLAVDLLEAVHAQLNGERIIGWFSFRQTSQLQPNAAEVNITNSMAMALESIQGSGNIMQPLFALVSTTPQHEGSSRTFQQCLFQANSHRYDLHPTLSSCASVCAVSQEGALVRTFTPSG